VSDSKKILLVGFHFPHHKSDSGYDVLSSYMSADYIDGDSLWFKKAAFGTVKRKINIMLLELVSIFKGINKEVVHYLYP